MRDVFHADTPAIGRRAAERLLRVLPPSPIREVKRLGVTLNRWAEPLLAYFATGGASNGGTEAINGLIELHAASPVASATATTTAYACS